MKLSPVICLLFLVFAYHPISAAASSKPEAGERLIEYEVNSGTWMSVDISPAGDKIIFDLIGHIYELPIDGGVAKSLTQGWGWHRAPRYSPDGSQILMVRDGEGMDEIWTMPARGGDLAQVTDHSSERRAWVCGSPFWLNNHTILYGAGAYPNTCGSSPGLRKIDLATKAMSLLHPDKIRGEHSAGSISPNGRWLFVTEERDNPQQVNDPSQPTSLVSMVRVDMSTRQRMALTSTALAHWEFTPQISRDGRMLAYIRRDEHRKFSLRIRRLHSNGDTMEGSDKELLSLSAEDDPYRFDEGDARPAYTFTPDGKYILIGAAGKIHKVSTVNGDDQIIPFTAKITRRALPTARPVHRLLDGPVVINAIQWPQLTPNGNKLIFAAVGYLWLQELPRGAPRRITNAGPNEFELMPSLSPDGKTVAFVAINRDGNQASPTQLMTIPLTGGNPRRVLSDGSALLTPNWSSDGSRLAFVKLTDDTASCGWVSSDGSRSQIVSSIPREGNHAWSNQARFAPDGRHLWCTSYKVASSGLASAEMHELPMSKGIGRKIAAVSEAAIGMLPSPDGRHAVILGVDHELWLMPLSNHASPTLVDFSSSSLRRITTTGAQYVAWDGNQSFIYSIGNQIYRYALDQKAAPQLIHTVQLTYPRRQAEETTAFVNGRIITVSGERGAGQVFEKGTVLLRGRRIEAVGATDIVHIPSNARIVDATGLTLMPAVMDTHYHPEMGGARPLNEEVLGSWETTAHGVTTVWVPGQAPWNEGFLPIPELRETGRIAGPRWIIPSEQPTVVAEARVQRMLSGYEDAARIFQHQMLLNSSVMKEYLTPRRDHRRLFSQAAHASNLGLVSHAQALEHALSRATDGYTGFDHAPFAVPVYEDVRQYLARTGIIWTPNFYSTAYGVESGTPLQDAFARELLKHWPEQSKKWNYYYPNQFKLAPSDSKIDKQVETRMSRVAQAAAYLMEAGVKVAVSAHNPPALLTHAEMWYMQEGGVPRGDIIRAGTLTGAQKIGVDQDLGSLESGKIADLLVLKGNPLENIIYTTAQKYIVSDGIVYDAGVTPPAPLRVEKSAQH